MTAKIVKLTTERFGSRILSIGLSGHAIHVEGQGFLSFRGNNADRSSGIKIPYTPIGGQRALKEIVATMDLADLDTFEYIHPDSV